MTFPSLSGRLRTPTARCIRSAHTFHHPSCHRLLSQGLSRGACPRFSSPHATAYKLSFTYMQASSATVCSVISPSRKRSRCVPRRPAPPAQFCRKCERSVSPVPGASEERAAAFVREALEERWRAAGLFV